MSIGLRCSQPARRPHVGLAASSCSYGREFALRFFQLGLATCASRHALRFATVTLIGSGWLLSSNKILPMLGTLGQVVNLRAIVNRAYNRRVAFSSPYAAPRA